MCVCVCVCACVSVSMRVNVRVRVSDRVLALVLELMSVITGVNIRRHSMKITMHIFLTTRRMCVCVVSYSVSVNVCE